MGLQIAIDGPSGSGKSTIAKKIAGRLGFVHIDTGAMYRAVALCAKDCDVDWEDEAGLLKMMEKIQIDIEYGPAGQRILLGGQDVTLGVRTAEMGVGASKVSVHERVRERLVALQKKLANGRNVVMDGRDIGTVVLADAPVKIFLTADAKVRAKRRCAELEALGRPADFDEIVAQIEKRDFDDSNRAISPLKIADDAVVLDASYLDIDQVVDEVLKVIDRKGVL